MIFAVAALFGERGLDGLEEADVVADRDRFVGGGAQGEGLRELGHDLDEALLAVLLLEDVLLRGGRSASFSAGVPSCHFDQSKPCNMPQAISCFSSMTAMASAVSMLGSPVPPLSV